MKNISILIATATAAILVSASVEAKNSGKLPKDAVPMTSDQTAAVYVGKTINWQPTLAFFAKDGTVKAIYPVKGKESFGEGTWSVKDNEFCSHIEYRWADKTAKPFVQDLCEKFFLSKGKIWVQNIKAEDQYIGDIYQGIEKKLNSGDKASAKADALKKKLGY